MDGRQLTGDQISEWLKTPGVRTFRYKANLPGLYFLTVFSLLLAALATWLVFRSGLSLTIHKIGFAILAGSAAFFIWLVARWALFSGRNYVGISDTEFMFGSGSSAKVLPLTSINEHTVDITKMQVGKYTSVFPIRVGDISEDLHLVGPFANLDHLPIFLETMLQRLIPGGIPDDADSD